MLVWEAGTVLVLLGELRRDVAVSVEKMLESLDTILKEVLECVFLVLLVLVQHRLALICLFPDAIGGSIETVSESFPLCLDLTIIALDGLFDEVPDPLLDAVNKLVGIVLVVCAPAVGLSLGIFEEGADVVLEVMVVDLADLQLDRLVCGLDVSFFLRQAVFDLCSSSGNLLLHNLIAELFEKGDSIRAGLLIVCVELSELDVDPIRSEFCLSLAIFFL